MLTASIVTNATKINGENRVPNEKFVEIDEMVMIVSVHRVIVKSANIVTISNDQTKCVILKALFSFFS